MQAPAVLRSVDQQCRSVNAPRTLFAGERAVVLGRWIERGQAPLGAGFWLSVQAAESGEQVVLAENAEQPAVVVFGDHRKVADVLVGAQHLQRFP